MLHNLSIEHPYSKIEIRSKRYPKQIWYLQPCSQLINLAEGQDHEKNQYPQCNQPDKGKTKVLEIEKYDAPKEIEGQLNQEEHQTACPVIGCRRQINSCCSNSHQSKQNAPDDGKYNAGRRQWRLLDG